MSSIFHYLSRSHIGHLDYYIDISRVLTSLETIDKDASESLYERTLKLKELPNGDIKFISLFGLIKTYRIIKHFNKSDQVSFHASEVITDITSYKYSKSHKYFIKQILSFVDDSIDDEVYVIENLHNLCLFNSIKQYYTKDTLEFSRYLNCIALSQSGNIKQFKKAISHKPYQSLIRGINEMRYHFNVKILKYICKQYEEIIHETKLNLSESTLEQRSAYHCDHKSGNHARCAVFAKKKNWPLIDIMLDEYINKLYEYANIIRKTREPTPKFRITVKIMRLFTTRNMSKLILYYV